MKSQLKLIQILRGVAASLVVIHHILAELFKSWSLQNINIGFGRSGVDLFFVISGFVILYSLVCFEDKKPFNNKNKIFNMLLKIGVSSYSLYLVHPFLIQAVFLIFPIEILEYNIFTTILVITISCLISGVITFNLIESNLTIVTKKLLNTIRYVKS